MSKNKLMIYQPADSSSESQVSGASPGCSGHKVGPPWTECPPFAGELISTHTYTVQTRCLPPVHGSVIWEENGASGENPRRHRDTRHTPWTVF